jgi:hypothetical protein
LLVIAGVSLLVVAGAVLGAIMFIQNRRRARSNRADEILYGSLPNAPSTISNNQNGITQNQSNQTSY